MNFKFVGMLSILGSFCSQLIDVAKGLNNELESFGSFLYEVVS
jgi:hypothetical protein